MREHLSALRLPPEREIEIVDELALHICVGGVVANHRGAAGLLHSGQTGDEG